MRKLIVLPVLILTLSFWSCKSNAQEHSKNEAVHQEDKGHDQDDVQHGKETKGHDQDDVSHDNEGEKKRGYIGEREGEEDGTQYDLNATYNITKHGVRLVLKLDKKANTFKGYMLNTTNKDVERARVEIHLSNGIELGPTKPLTLKPKMKKEISLKASGKSFKTWSAHAEFGSNEHGHGGNHEGGERHLKSEH